MTMDTDSRKKLKQFWRKRLLFGLGTVGVLGLGVGTIGLMRSTYDELQIIESRDVPEQFYQQQVAQVQTVIDRQPTMIVPQDKQQDAQGLFNSFSGQRSPCYAIDALGQLKDPRAIPLLGKLLQDSQTRRQSCDGQSPSNDGIYMGAVRALGQFRRENATAYLKAALVKSPEPEILALWKEDADHIAITQKLEVLRVLGPILKYDQHWKDLVIQMLPELNQLGRNQDNQSGEIAALESEVYRIIAMALHGQKDNLKLRQAIITLSQDKALRNRLLENVTNALRSQEEYESLLDILYIQAEKANKTGDVWSIDPVRQPHKKPDPQVLRTLIGVIQDKKLSDFVSFRIVERFLRREQYAQHTKQLFLAAEKAGGFGSTRMPTEWRNEFEAHSRKMNIINYDNGSPTQNNYRSLLSSLYSDSVYREREASTENRSSIPQLQQLNIISGQYSRDLWSKANIGKAIPALKSLLQYPVLRKDGDVQASEPNGYLTKYWTLPCDAATGLLYLNNTEGIQPCITVLRNVAAIQYATEKQRQPFYAGQVGSSMNMIQDQQDKEYHFSALDVAVFSWAISSKFSNGITSKPLLVMLLKDLDPEVRRAAMFSLSHTKNDEDLPVIMTALRDSDPVVREYALRYFRPATTMGLDISQRSKLQALKGLQQASRDPDRNVKHAAKLMVSKVSQSSNEAFLLNMLHDTDHQIRYNSIRSLCGLGEKMIASIDAVIQQEKNAILRMEATTCLASWVKDSQANNPQIIATTLALLLSNPKEIELTVSKFDGKLVEDSSTRYRETILEIFQTLADRGQLTLDEMQARQAIPILLKISKNSNDSNLNQISAIRVLKAIYEKFPMDKVGQDRTYLFLNLQGGMLAGIGITSLVLLFSSLRLRNPFPLMWTGYLIFPEEIVAELMALKQRRQAEKVAPRRIRLELVYEVVLLFWAVHVQIRIDNLNLPPGGNDRAK